MIKLLLAALLLLPFNIAFGSEEIVFQAFPTKLGDTVLSKADSAKGGVLIKKVKGRYIWASREDKELIYNRSGIFHVFTAVNGSGIISIGDNRSIPKALRGDAPDFEYGEHLRFGTGILSYTGKAEFITRKHEPTIPIRLK